MEITTTEVQQRLVGIWRLVRWEERDPGGTVTHPLGKDAIGQIMCDAEGRMSAQLVRRDQVRFAMKTGVRRALTRTPPWSNYFGYFGTDSIDEYAKKVTRHIEGSWFPNLIRQDQERYYRFEGEQLVLDAKTARGQVRIIWENA